MSYSDEYRRWMESGALTPEELEELAALQNNEGELESRFFGPLAFGTAGLRGTMGLGLNRMNAYVVRHTTQGFAKVILESEPDAAERGVAICMDCRMNSAEFARQAACVMAANGIRVRLFEAMRPTPELSFAIREYGCMAGINITASHNPKEYNGYKVYWEDGAQLPPQHAAAIASALREIDMFSGVRTMKYEDAVGSGLITLLGGETDERFLKRVLEMASDRDVVARVADRFKIVYTPFHGTGYRLVPEALRRLGMKHILCVPEQMIPDGSFPTVKSPNPEEAAGFALAVQLARENDVDLIIGTDPDADRVGIMVREKNGEYVTVSGNQTGVLLLDYLIGAKRRAGTLPKNPAALKTIVTTEMARRVAEENGVLCFDTFTGFKFMAEKIKEFEDTGGPNVIFSYEESYGYMVGDYVRDKDAVTASMLLSEMAAWYASRNMTLSDALAELYEKYGHYMERTVNLMMPGLDGMRRMKQLMEALRERPLAQVAGTPVLKLRDYRDGTVRDLHAGKAGKMELSGSDVLRFDLADKTAFIVRPSGTEPKIKVYVLACGNTMEECREKVSRYGAFAETLGG
ncbi:phospho-sugar mutase [Papillibacter cinnamivorans]|uniref:phosphoglucomutase (alpha-D-glucose-1,6-bisphosphate-dependent) n=1 Tax=Papillibacter cinnamivorans DSM 12816 TaxID=1122930 RepID=A0A1W2CPE2_9FIRM|nr:phospho-sugar mutase [Papillibacter cinnamivorans]SMC86498.1 phosphoglucomutase [Papillibacter cinnamivorans DSM 12816]